MENKYYTPDLTEFHIGFEYEFLQHHGSPEQEWVSLTLTQISDGEDDARLGLTLKALENYDNVYIRNAWRVKYLDQSDIESFGFKEDYDDAEGNVWFRLSSNDRWRLNFMEHTANNIWIVDDTDESYDDTVFKGVIKNKSELNKLLKQLNIIE